MNGVNAEPHTLVGAYALDALDEREQVVFEQHLAGCPTCAAELVEFRATAARLGEAASMTPPTRLRGTVLEAARRTQQLRPVVVSVPLSRWRRYSSTLLAAAVVLAVVTLGGVYLTGNDGDDGTPSEQDQIEAIMSATDRVVRPAGDGDVPVRVYWSPSIDQAVVQINDLPDIDDGQSYEMWAIDADGAQSMGAMPESTDSGEELVDGLDDATAVALTVEQAGGSATGQPTTEPVVTIPLN